MVQAAVGVFSRNETWTVMTVAITTVIRMMITMTMKTPKKRRHRSIVATMTLTRTRRGARLVAAQPPNVPE